MFALCHFLLLMKATSSDCVSPPTCLGCVEASLSGQNEPTVLLSGFEHQDALSPSALCEVKEGRAGAARQRSES